MMENGSDILQTTRAGLETGLRVRHITTYALDTCQPDDTVEDVLTKPEHLDFDCIPVRNNGHIIGYIQREPDLSGRVSDQMRPIEESVLVSADLPLTQYMALIPERPFRLVLDGVMIRGIVTWSDLQKLPVRLFVFSLITHLEMVMAQCIQDHYPVEVWLQKISSGRRARIDDKREALFKKNLEPPLIELTDFCDKRDILAKTIHPSERFIPEMKAIEDLRNTTAHAATYAQSREAVQNFVECLQRAEYWIDYLANRHDLASLGD